jgi:hypothetical protein
VKTAEKKLVKRGVGAIRKGVLTFFFRKLRSTPPKHEPFSQEMHLKIPLKARACNCQNLNHVLHFFFAV